MFRDHLKTMSIDTNKNHPWCAIYVKSFTFPRTVPISYVFKSKTLLGASMKASNKLKELEEGYRIQCVYLIKSSDGKPHID